MRVVESEGSSSHGATAFIFSPSALKLGSASRFVYFIPSFFCICFMQAILLSLLLVRKVLSDGDG